MAKRENAPPDGQEDRALRACARDGAAGSPESEISSSAGHKFKSLFSIPSLSQSGRFRRKGCHCWTKPGFQIFPVLPTFPTGQKGPSSVLVLPCGECEVD